MEKFVRVYQDIDCVLNASHNARAWRTENDTVDAGYRHGWARMTHDDDGYSLSQTGWTDFVGPKYKMEWNERAIAALNSLTYELVWCTTWRADALEVGRLMGLTPKRERVLHPRSGTTTFPSLEWKYDAVLAEQQENPAPFVWLEDELAGLPRQAREVIHQLGGLMIAPNPDIGLTPEHIKEIKAYIASHS